MNGAGVIGHLTGETLRATRARARVAERLRVLPNVETAFRAGDISLYAVQTLIRAADETSDEAVDGSELLIGWAASSADDNFGRRIETWIKDNRVGPPDDGAEEINQQRARRTLRYFTNENGDPSAFLSLDRKSMGELKAAIEARTRSLRAIDARQYGQDSELVRTVDQARADAMVDLVARPASTTTGKRPARHSAMLLTEIGALTGNDPNAAIALPGHGPIPLGLAQMMTCDAELFTAIRGPTGVILDLSPGTRKPSEDQIRALIARDQGCVIGGDAPEFCDAHHIIHWANDGLSILENLVLLCRGHHHELHDNNRNLIQHPDLTWTSQPTRAGPHTTAA